MIFDKEDYKAFDPELWNAIDAEAERQQNNIELWWYLRQLNDTQSSWRVSR